MQKLYVIKNVIARNLLFFFFFFLRIFMIKNKCIFAFFYCLQLLMLFKGNRLM